MSMSRFGSTHESNTKGGQLFHLDIPLFLGLVALAILGLLVLYSASGEDMAMMQRQVVRLGIGFSVMIILAQIPPINFLRWTPWLFGLGVLFLIGVLLFGHTGKGAQRWLDLGFFKFQPSEMMKLVVPMMVAWYLHSKPLPCAKRQLGIGLIFIILPVVLIIQQPDLGTSLLIACAGIFVLLLSGISTRLIVVSTVVIGAFAPVMWFFGMHDYQRQRVLTFLNPESDPLGSGYHIIQSKIAIGSGGLYGKGWFNGTQSQLDFLPERHTDFIFAVYAEEFGFIGILLLLAIFMFIILRGLYIAVNAQETYGRLVAGSFIFTFFIYLFVNIGMVSGLLPVVGVPLPLVSYGGTSMVTIMASFGILMSIHTHRRLLPA